MTTLARLVDLTERLATSTDTETLVATALDGLVEHGIPHVVLLLADETGDVLYNVGTRGYDRSGVGAEVLLGAGFIGTAAASRRTLRVGYVRNALLYSRAVRVESALAGEPVGREIALPGLPHPGSVLAVPLVARDELVGVLAAESPRAAAFTEEVEHQVRILASVLGPQLVALGTSPPTEAVDVTPSPAAASADGPPLHVSYFAVDDSVFVDHEYVIKGVAGRILTRLLREHATGRCAFTNRELRVDPWLGLPGYRDNLENRLLLLRQRLDEKALGIRMIRSGRGRFTLEVDRPVELTEHLET